MIAVAICTLGSLDDTEARALAADLGVVAYEARLKLAQPTPIVVLRSADRGAAESLVKKLQARGHDAVALDEDAVPPPSLVRAVRLDDAAFRPNDASLAYGDVLALVRATLALRGEKVDKVTERKLRLGAAIATGGVVMTKKVTREEKHVTHDRDELLYVFPRSGGPPWLVSEHDTVYTALAGAARTQHENFARVVAELRARTASICDERMLALRHETARRALDLRAQMLAIPIARGRTVNAAAPRSAR